MTTLAAYISELGPLVEQLEKAVAAGPVELSAGQYFEWRIRARLIEDKLYQAAKPPGAPRPEEEDQILKVPVFSEPVKVQAKAALPMSAALRDALQNRRIKLALDAARGLARAVTR